MTAVDDFRRLHEDFLLLPNAWDVVSAAALVREGFPAVGTTSLGVAATAGLRDGSGQARATTLDLARRLTALPVPVSVDVEGGFSEDAGAVRELGAELAAAGVAGVNIEDGLASGGLREPAVHARLVSAMADSGVFVNARTDTHWLREGEIEDALARCRAYVEAGADGVFVPGLKREADIAAIAGGVDAPLNVLYAPTGPRVARLAELGVARVSTGSLLFRASLLAAVTAAVSVRNNADLSQLELPSYEAVDGLSRAN
jgi:2-methylisocitrate lyase-like PEP mutase family enzyme